MTRLTDDELRRLPLQERVTQAKFACYDRLHPIPAIDSSPGARRLYDAVCDLWLDVMQDGQRRPWR